MEAHTETRVGRLRAAVGKERRRTLYALSSAVLVMLTLCVVSFYYRQKVQTMDADRASLQETLNRQKEEFARASAQLAERLKEANLDVGRREQEADDAKKRADTLEQKAKEAVASEKRTKELAEAAVQAEREARIKAVADLTSERTITDAERKLRVTAEADRKACQEAKQHVDSDLAECRARLLPASPDRFKLP